MLISWLLKLKLQINSILFLANKLCGCIPRLLGNKVVICLTPKMVPTEIEQINPTTLKGICLLISAVENVNLVWGIKAPFQVWREKSHQKQKIVVWLVAGLVSLIREQPTGQLLLWQLAAQYGSPATLNTSQFPQGNNSAAGSHSNCCWSYICFRRPLSQSRPR